MATNRGFSRRDRIAEQIRRELAEVIRTELRDPRVAHSSMTDEPSIPHYTQAKLFCNSLAVSHTLES